ncbi:MAG: DUF4434 domain-containing protein [Chitinophagales bacterium]|nr:DUF4434 domain-containing protein [Chitinophagales bacterium]
MKNTLKFIIALVLFSFSVQLLAQSGPVKVEVVEKDGQFSLLRGGKPYYVKGVGGNTFMDKMVEVGANSLRTWGPEGAQEILDKAHKRGITVTLGLWVGQERQGFDYNDEWAVKGQLEYFREVVTKYKDHPALLMWGVGNEMDLFYSNLKVWDALGDIATMIKEVDPNHPIMTVTAGIDVAEIQLIKERAPDVDILGINVYGDIPRVPKFIDLFGWDGPYMVTEWGPTGTWEVFKTDWHAAVDETSTDKAQTYLTRFENYIAADKDNCVGSYVFLWGSKQETTSTWFSMFTPDGKETGAVQVMQYCFTGQWPANRCPEIQSFTVDGKVGYDNIYLKGGQNYKAEVKASDLDNDQLTYVWQMYKEPEETGTGGDFEADPVEIEGFIEGDAGPSVTIKAPKAKGGYRLFIFIYDGHDHVATANHPFYIK